MCFQSNEILAELDELTQPLSYAWDCDPRLNIPEEAFDAGLDEEDDEGDWQVIVLDRFHDRMVNGGLYIRGEVATSRCW